MLVHVSRCTSPHLAKSGIGRAARAAAPPVAEGPALPTLLRRRRACSLTSSCEMRPTGPLPATALISTPISRARRRTAGEAAAGIRLEDTGAVAGAGGGDVASTGWLAPSAVEGRAGIATTF